MKDYKKQKIDEKINFFMARNKNSKSSELIDWHERFGMARINFLAFFELKRIICIFRNFIAKTSLLRDIETSKQTIHPSSI